MDHYDDASDRYDERAAKYFAACRRCRKEGVNSDDVEDYLELKRLLHAAKEQLESLPQEIARMEQEQAETRAEVIQASQWFVTHPIGRIRS